MSSAGILLLAIWTGFGQEAPPASAGSPSAETPVAPIGAGTLLEVDPDAGGDGAPQRPVPEHEAAALRRLLNPALFGDRFTERTGFFVDGWLRQSYAFNGYRPPSGFNGPTALLDRADGYRFNQGYLRVGRNVNSNGCRFDFGGQVDLLYGADAEFAQAYGLDDRWITGDTDCRLAMPQAYVEAFAPLGAGLKIKVGRFYSPIGYEFIPAPSNFFATNQYAYLYGEPITHTGVLAEQKLSDRFSLIAGVVRGWDNWDDNNDDVSFLGGATWTGCDKSGVAFTLVAGPEQDDDPQRPFQGVAAAPGESLNRICYSLVVQRPLGSKLRAVLQHDAGWQDGSGVAGFAPAAQWYGVNQYLFYEFNECLQVGVRAEWFRDDDGVRVAPKRASRAVGNLASPSDYYALSLGANLKANEFVILRPEVRWDFQQRDDPNSPRQFDDGRRSSQFLAAVDLILRF